MKRSYSVLPFLTLRAHLASLFLSELKFFSSQASMYRNSIARILHVEVEDVILVPGPNQLVELLDLLSSRNVSVDEQVANSR